MTKENTANDPWADFYTVTSEVLSPEQQSVQDYLEKAGTGRALASGIAEGATFGFADEIQALIDQLTGASKEPGYLTPEQRTAILKTKEPGAYMGADIATSLITGAIPFLGQARLAANAPRAAQMIGKAMPGIQAGLGSLEAAGRGGDAMDILAGGALGAATQALPLAGEGVAGLAGKFIGKKASPQLEKKAAESAKELRQLRKTFEPSQYERQQLKAKKQDLSKALMEEKQAVKSIFDEPVEAMTAGRASQLQQELFNARKAADAAYAAEKSAAATASEADAIVASAREAATAAQLAVKRNNDKILEYAAKGGKVGEVAKKILTAPTMYAIGGDKKLSSQQAEELAFLEMIDRGEEPKDQKILKAAKELMQAVAQ